jgi:hypothetical protein
METIIEVFIFQMGYNRYTSTIILMILANFTGIFVKLALFYKIWPEFLEQHI